MGQIRYLIPDDLHRRLKVQAAEQGITVRELVIRLLAEGVEREEQKK